MKKALPLCLIIIILCSACGKPYSIEWIYQKNAICNSANRGLMAQCENNIYFVDIYQEPPVVKQFDITTRKTTELFAAVVTYLTPLGDKLFFLNASDNMSVYSYNLIDETMHKEYEYNCTGLTEYNDTLYFVENKSIMQLNPDTQDVRCLYQTPNNKLGNLWPTTEGIYFLEYKSTDNAQQLVLLRWGSAEPEIIVQEPVSKFYKYNSDFIILREEILYLYAPTNNKTQKLLDEPISMDSICIYEDYLFCSTYDHAFILNLITGDKITLPYNTRFSTYVISGLFCYFAEDEIVGFNTEGVSGKLFAK